MNPALFSFFTPENVRIENERSGYGDQNYVLNGGSVFWFFWLYFLGFIVFKIVLKLFKKLKETKIEKKLTSFFVYSFLIRLLIEGYLELLFAALIQVKAF